jgi:hypothetical protein
MDRMGQPRRAGSAVAASVVVALLAGCSPDAPEDPSDPPTPSVALRVETVSGAGDLDQQTRTELETEVAEVLSAYVVEAFLGDFPRNEFVQAFGSFTSGAARDAARDIDQLTAARVEDASAVAATSLDARLSFLVAAGDVVGATAAVDLAFDATMPDGSTRPVTLQGRLLLEEDDGDWAVFGYDVALDDGADVPAEVTP